MKSFNSLMVGVVPIQLPQSHSVQRNEDCTGWDLTPQEKRAGGVTFSSKTQQLSGRRINVRIRHNSAVRMKYFPTQEETKLQLRCEGG